MPSYKVEYTTADRSSAPLKPLGAKEWKTEALKPLPVKVKGMHTYADRYLGVTRGLCDPEGAIIEVKIGLGGRDEFCLTADDVDKLIAGLSEARGPKTDADVKSPTVPLPFKMETSTDIKPTDIRRIEVHKSYTVLGAYVNLNNDSRGIWLNKDETQKVIAALQATL